MTHQVVSRHPVCAVEFHGFFVRPARHEAREHVYAPRMLEHARQESTVTWKTNSTRVDLRCFPINFLLKINRNTNIHRNTTAGCVDGADPTFRTNAKK